MYAKLHQLCQTLCDPMDFSPQAPLSLGFSKQEYWSEFPCPPPGDLPDPGTEPTSLIFPALAGGIFTTSTTWEAKLIFEICHLSFDLAVCDFWSYTLKFQFGSQILSRVIPQGKYATVTKRGM